MTWESFVVKVTKLLQEFAAGYLLDGQSMSEKALHFKLRMDVQNAFAV
jgi:hypothetical protein